MVSFTVEERNLMDEIKITVGHFFPHDFDYSAKENLIKLLQYWKGKGYCAPFRSDNGFQNSVYISLLAKFGVVLPTRTEILKKQSDEEQDAMLKRVNASFDKRINSIKARLDRANKEKAEAVIANKVATEAILKKVEAEKAELEARLESANSAIERQKAAHKAEAIKKLKNETEIDPDGNKVKKCWECGQWFKIAAGTYTKHVKECQGINVGE